MIVKGAIGYVKSIHKNEDEIAVHYYFKCPYCKKNTKGITFNKNKHDNEMCTHCAKVSRVTLNYSTLKESESDE